MTPVQVVQHGNRQSGTLGRVRSGAELIKENKGIPVRSVQEGDNVFHVRREGRERLLNALFISYIGINFPEESKLRMRFSRNVKP